MVKNRYHLPAPTGKFRVGIKKFGFIDETRQFRFGPKEGAARELGVIIWYPAESTDNMTTSTYFAREELDALKNHASQKIVSMLIHKKLYNIITNSYYGAPIAQNAKYPLILFNGALPQQMQFAMEELASHGYIVVSLGYTYESLLVSFPDGRIIVGTGNEKKTKETAALLKSKMFKDYLKATRDDNITVEEIKKWTRKMPSGVVHLHESMKEFVGDNSFILEKMKEMNNGDHIDKIFQNKIDFSRGAGIFGHSGGGNMASEACYTNNQFSCGVNMDSWCWGEMYKSEIPLNTPQMFLMTKYCWNSLLHFHTANRQDSYYVKIKKAHHMDLTDGIFFLRALRMAGIAGLSKMKPDLLHEITTDYLLAFFNKYLKNLDSKYLEKPMYPEVDLDINRKEK